MKKTMKKLLSLLLVLTMTIGIAPLSGFAGLELPQWLNFENLFNVEAEAETYNGKCGYDLIWSLDIETGVLNITGTGKMYDYAPYAKPPLLFELPWHSYRNSIKAVNIADGVTSIGDYEFYRCENLTSVVIPESVTNIGSSAFSECKSLTDVYYTGNIESWCNISFGNSSANPMYYAKDFYINNTLVKEIVVPDTITQIKDYAFCSFIGITKVIIPDSVTSIGSSAFSGCVSLTSITIPDSVTSIGFFAFSECKSLTDVYYTGNIESWCNISFGNSSANPMYYAKNFYINNTLVKEIVIPDTVTEIKEAAFYGFKGITSVTIPDSVTSIGDWAFDNCKGLTSVVIPDSVTSIGKNAFSSCTSLTDVYYTGDIESWCNISFDDYQANPMYYAKNFYINNTLVKEIVIPDTVTEIKNYTFYGFKGITLVAISDSVASIGGSAFSGCVSLTSVAIPDSVTSIGSSAFSGCANLTSITIPDSVTNIGGNAFYDTAYYNDSTNWENNVLYMGNHLIKAKNTLSSSYEIKAGTKTIANYAFYNWTSLTSVTIPDSITSIGSTTFYEYANYTDVYYTGNIESWCTILFSTNDANPMYYAKNFYIDNTLVKEIVIPDTVTEIKDYAFWGFHGITSVTIPESVTNIGSSAFYGCTNLTDVYYTGNIESWCNILFSTNDANPMYYAKNFYIDNTLVKEIVIPDTVTEIKDYAFGGFHGITSVTIPDSVTNIGDFAFYRCTSLTPITIPDSVISIGEGAFSGCGSLTSITLPDSVTSIGESVFSGCGSLTSITILGNIKSIGDSTFWGCTSLTSVTMENGVTSIGHHAFYNCTSLTSVTIGNSVTSIGGWAFDNCTSLTDVYYTGDIESWCNISFDNYQANPMYYAKSFYINNTLVKEIVIPDTVTEIRNYAFYGFKGITSVTIPDSVASIGGSAFSDCTNLTSVTIGNGVTSIGGSAFSDCTNLTSVTIGNGVTNIVYYAFRNCTSLTSVTIGKGVTIIGWGAFGSCTSLTDVYYNGTEEEWNEILINKQNEHLLNATIHFLDEACGDEHNYQSTVTPPTCAEQGYTTYVCSRCGDTYVGDYVSAPGHTDGEWKVTKEPTCTKDGLKVRICSVCNAETEEKIIPYLGHEIKVTITPNPQYCELDATKHIVCMKCDYEEWIIIPAPGHNYESIVTPPTYSEQGYTTYTCSRCGDSYKDNFVPALGKVIEVSVDDISLTYKDVCKIEPEIRIQGDVELFVSYSSSDPSIAMVDEDGVVTATGRGEAEITVTVTDEHGNVAEDTCTVTVSYTWWQWLIVIFLFGWIWY